MWVEGCYGISTERGAYAGSWIEGWVLTGSDNKPGARMMFICNITPLSSSVPIVKCTDVIVDLYDHYYCGYEWGIGSSGQPLGIHRLCTFK